MKYVKFTIKTKKYAEDLMAEGLMDLGYSGVEIEDAFLPDDIREKGTFYDVLPDTGAEGDEAFISFYVEDPVDKEAVIKEVTELIDSLRENIDVGEGSVSVSETEDKDWINNWKEFFKSFTIEFEDGKKALFRPSWEAEDGENIETAEYCINIDPGTAFGTGAHETTRLCIRALEKHVKKGDVFLDAGTGSGILSMLCFLFGAERGTLTDVDEGAVPAVKDNFEKNGLSDKPYRLIIGDMIEDENVRDSVGAGYDLVVANILAEVLIPLTGWIPYCLKPGGIFITSGIYENKAEQMKKCLEFNDFEVIEENRDGEWVSYVSVLR